ncbi:F-box domain-containing protein [Favolaschia claudopus]|uniref:F-box domain-containing protein n=1 Tax=Favolaschia claudopus TaxID=2862362 RepID=A0AAW0EHW6_9AGAR
MTTLLTLPPEITVKIFMTFIADIGDTFPAVLRLSPICKALRDLVVNSPILWSRFCIKYFRDLDGVKLFVERSKSCLLDVSVYFNVMGSISPEVIQSLAVARWRKLTVRGSSSGEVKPLLQEIINIATPYLSEVHVLPYEQSPCYGHCPLLLGASDALRSLTLRGCVGCLAPLPNLTRLNILRLDCTYEEFRNLIQGSPNLITLALPQLQDRFSSETFSEPVISNRVTIEAPSVRYFAVGFTNSDLTLTGVQPLLSFLSMPNLEYLEIVGSRADYGEFSGKSFPALKTLCLRDMNFPASNPALYRAVPNITCLRLKDIDGVESLTAPDENGALPWSHLNTVRCDFWYDDPNDYSWLQKLLEHRPRLTLEFPVDQKGHIPPITDHDVRFSDDLWGLIGGTGLGEEWEDDDEEVYSDFSGGGEFEAFGGDSWDYEYDGFENGFEEDEDYFDDDDDGDGWW